jgi:hypothetical protein
MKRNLLEGGKYHWAEADPTKNDIPWPATGDTVRWSQVSRRGRSGQWFALGNPNGYKEE